MIGAVAWMVLHWRGLALAAGVALAIAGGWLIVDRIRDGGRREILEEVQSHNQEATDAARRAREIHDLECARGEPECLRDDWTRDGRR